MEGMGKLTTKERNALPKSDFAIPEERKYPIEDKSHARNALARVSANGTPEEKAEVRNAVYERYPSLDPPQRIEGQRSQYITYDFSAKLPDEETRKRIGYADSTAGPFKCSDCRYGKGGCRACSKFHILVEPNACCSSYEKK